MLLALNEGEAACPQYSEGLERKYRYMDIHSIAEDQKLRQCQNIMDDRRRTVCKVPGRVLLCPDPSALISQHYTAINRLKGSRLGRMRAIGLRCTESENVRLTTCLLRAAGIPPRNRSLRNSTVGVSGPQSSIIPTKCSCCSKSTVKLHASGNDLESGLKATRPVHETDCQDPLLTSTCFAQTDRSLIVVRYITLEDG